MFIEKGIEQHFNKTMGEKGRELIYGKWNWSIEEKNLLCLYKELGDEYKKM